MMFRVEVMTITVGSKCRERDRLWGVGGGFLIQVAFRRRGAKCGIVNTEETSTPIHSSETLIMWKLLLNVSLSHSFSLTVLNPSAPSIPNSHLSRQSVSYHSAVDNYLKLQSKGLGICSRYFAVFSPPPISPDPSLHLMSTVTVTANFCNPMLSLHNTSEEL
jgi:hypothetical protein